ncbi:peptidylprolyl isomerase [Nevskia sp.]|uniref:FKBP-type peptidyl-prolyl cis-trans isomerase n=1 Tax=Nevskia sp. TaxID=1929292 RepID=UPI0025CEA451|nr:peptidylprolyl isomerase [Nevskia sp.]
MQIADRCVAYFHYTLTNAGGDVLDSSEGRDPLPYLHGKGNIVVGLEKALAGKQAGDKLNVVVSAEEGYGAHNPALVQKVPKAAFQGVDNLEPGMQFQAESNMGPVSVVITAIEGDEVTVDGNHPLAGETLHFAVEITSVREASVEEVLHGHVHGAGGHHH